ncbi:MAG: PQQ-dependent sugar dehydrogenase [Actinomycetota bacterium]
MGKPGESWAVAAVVAALAISLIPAASAPGAQLEDVGTYATPIYVTSDPDDHTRLFVVQRAGQILLDDPDDPGPATTFLDLSSQPALVSCCSGERGLLSVALPADFAETGRLYVFYTASDGDLQIDEFTASGNSVDRSTRRPLMTIEHSSAENHNGGQLQFGPDGYLYLATGDGGTGGDNGQSLDTLLGKVLRIDPRQSGAAPYSIPADNPFVGGPGLDEIWSYGLRNPWRFSFDRATGALLIGDVGEGSWEEVDYEPVSAGMGAGDNFGWDCREGLHDFELSGCTGPFTDPIFEYPHLNPGGGAAFGCSITGGFVVRDPSVPDLLGRYVFADLCAGDLRSLAPALPSATDERSEGLSVPNPYSFGEDACARLYVALGSGPVRRLHGPTPASCGVFRGLSVQTEGSGSGQVFGPGIDCPPNCAESYGDGVFAILTATAGASSSFAGWTGCPQPDGSRCLLAMDSDRSVTAGFESTRRCGGRKVTDVGTSGRDVLRGTRKRDVISALGGRDVIRGLGARDRLCGGGGADKVFGAVGRDLLLGGRGDDLLRGGPGRDHLKGGWGRDRLRGGPGRDRLRGGAGEDHQAQ